MVWTTGVDSSAHALCSLHSQRRQTGGSMMAYIQREEWQQRRGEQEQRWRRRLLRLTGILTAMAWRREEGWRRCGSSGWRRKNSKMHKISGGFINEQTGGRDRTRRGVTQDVVWGTVDLWWVQLRHGGDVIGAAGMTAGYQMVWKKYVLLHSGRGRAAGETALPPPPHWGRKETVGVGFTSSVFPYPPLSHSLFVALFGDVSSLLQLIF